MILLPFIIVFAVCLMIPFILRRRGMGAGSVYKIAFSVVIVLFVASLVFAMPTLMNTEATSIENGMSSSVLIAALSLWLAIFLFPVAIVYGVKAFRKRGNEAVEKLDDGTVIDTKRQSHGWR